MQRTKCDGLTVRANDTWCCMCLEAFGEEEKGKERDLPDDLLEWLTVRNFKKLISLATKYFFF